MDGAAVIESVLSAHTALTNVVPASRILVDEAEPLGTALPAIQIETISRTDRNIPNPGAKNRVRERVRIRIHATDGVSRTEVRDLVRKALRAGRFPTISGLSSVNIETDGEGPDGIHTPSNVRIGIQDAFVAYLEDR